MHKHIRLQAPFPWFGGKSRVAPLVWQALGNCPNVVEPFAGSLAVLLGRPHPPGIETANDKDGLICNFWRSVQHQPDEVAYYADWPVNECDLHARHIWLVHQLANLTPRLEGDPDYYNAKIAGWWVWGISAWIGSEFCSGKGPWQIDDDGRLVHLGTAGQGVHRQQVHLGDAGQGVHRQQVHLGSTASQGLEAWMQALCNRLRHVRVCCGDWTRVLGPTPTTKQGLTGVFLDPPYDEEERNSAIYRTETPGIAREVKEWAVAHGDDPMMRIVLCGYEGEHAMPDSWRAVEWKGHGGYGTQGQGRGRENARRERLWLSPHCLRTESDIGYQGMLF